MLKNSLLVASSIVVAVLLSEIGLRVAGIAYPEFNKLDAELGWSPRPNTEGFHAIEGRTWMRINKAGFRDIDHATSKPKNIFRIAVLGDSFAEGREVSLDKVFWKVMERKLQSCKANSNRKYEVLNFAVNGYGTAQQYIVLKNHVWQYKPDAILLAFFTGNDVWNNAKELDGHRDRPYFDLKGNKIILNNKELKSSSFKSRKFWSDLKHGIYNQLHTLQIARQAYKKIRYSSKNEKLPIEKQLSAGLNNGIYNPPTTPAWKKAWKVTETLIELMSDDIKRHGNTKFWIASLSTPLQVYPDIKTRRSLARVIGASDLNYPDRRLSDYADSLKIPIFTLAGHLQKYADKHNVRLHGNSAFAGGHWNETGHRIAGERLSQVLCETEMNP